MHTHTKFCAFCHFRNLSHVYRVCFILHKNNKTKTKLPKRSWCRQLRTAVGIINVYHLSAFCMLCYIPKCFHAQDHSNCFHFNPFPVWKWSNASQPKQNKTQFIVFIHIFRITFQTGKFSFSFIWYCFSIHQRDFFSNGNHGQYEFEANISGEPNFYSFENDYSWVNEYDSNAHRSHHIISIFYANNSIFNLNISFRFYYEFSQIILNHRTIYRDDTGCDSLDSPIILWNHNIYWWIAKRKYDGDSSNSVPVFPFRFI